MTNRRLEIIIPARNLPNGIRPQCAFVEDRRVAPPRLLEGDGLACNIIEVSPAGTTFPGPVMIQVPYSASLRNLDRELIIWRCDSDDVWKIHINVGSTLDSILISPQERILRILTYKLPRYFAVVSRVRQDAATIDPAGGIVASSAARDAQVLFPVGAVREDTEMSVQFHQVPSDMASHFLGTQYGAGCIVTIEPRRKKFNKPIKVTVPMPKRYVKSSQTEYYCTPANYRLYCSVAAEHKPSQWEDVTWCNNLTNVNNDTLQFVTIVAGRYWLVDCGQDIHKQGNEEQNLLRDVRILYRHACAVPYWIRFCVLLRRLGKRFAALHVVLLMDDGGAVKPIIQDDGNLREICRSGPLEVTAADQISLEVDGNVHIVTKNEKLTRLVFLPLHENIIRGLLKIHDPEEPLEGRLRILKDIKSKYHEVPRPLLFSSSIRL